MEGLGAVYGPLEALGELEEGQRDQGQEEPCQEVEEPSASEEFQRLKEWLDPLQPIPAYA